MAQQRARPSDPAPCLEVDLAAFRRSRSVASVCDLVFTVPPGPTGLGPRVQLAEAAVVSVHLAGDAAVVRVDVGADLRLHCPCDRCLDPVVLDLPVAFSEEWRLVRAQRADRGVPSDAAADVEGDADDGSFVRRAVAEHTAYLDPALWQNAALGLPAKVLCTKDCRGLCPQCGAAWNRGPCGCRETAPEAPLAALGDWRQKPRANR